MPQPNKRITVKSLIQEAWHTISHVEQGLRYTIKSLTARPGKMIHGYINGSRKNYQKPFSLLFIVTTVFALLLYWMNYQDVKHVLENSTADFHTQFVAKADYLESKFYSWLHIGLLPFYGLISMLIFRQLKYNWAEWMVTCCYIISFILLLLIPYQLCNKIFNFSNTANFYIQLVIIASYANLVMTDLIPGKQRLLVVLQTIIWCLAVFFVVSIHSSVYSLVNDIMKDF